MVRLKTLAPAVPYVTVPVGLYLFENGWVSILLYHAGMIAVLYMAKYGKLGSRLKRGRDYLVLLLVVSLSALIGLFIFVLWPLINAKGLILAVELTKLGLRETPWFLFMVYYFTINPIIEEVFWRGYLGHQTLKLTGTDAFFAGYHGLVLFLFVEWPLIIFCFVGLVLTSWAWRQMARIFQGLTMPILSHAAADAAIIGAVFLLAQ